MNEIRRVVRSAARRLLFIDFLHTFSIAALVVLTGLIIALLVQRLSGLEGWAWGWIFIGSGGTALGGAMVWSAVRRRTMLAAARALDEAAQLRESLSTALAVERSQDPWAAVVVETARAKAASVKVGVAIPVRAPRHAFAPFAALVALAIMFFAVPLVKSEAKKKQEKKEAEILEVKADLQKKDQKLEELLARAKVDLKSDLAELEGKKADEKLDPKELERAALRQLTSLNEKLNEMKEGANAKKLEQLKEMMEKLRQPGPGPMQELSRNLMQGNFAKAEEALRELGEQLRDQKLPEAAKEQLQKQMENLSEQLKKAAEQKTDMAKKLEQAGMSGEKAKELAKKLASDPQAVQEAIEKMKELSEEQKQQLKEMAKAMSEACKQCNGLGEAMSKMGKEMAKSGGAMSQEMMEGMQQAGEMLGEMEQMGEEMEALEAALKECQSQMGELGGRCSGGDMEGDLEGDQMGIGEWKEGDSSASQGLGSGGPGRGLGPSTQDSPADFKIDKTKQKVAQKEGPIIGSRMVYGDQVRGESTAEFTAAVASGEQKFTEALENNLISREHQDAVKTYFGRLEKKTKAKDAPKDAASAAPASSAPPAAPAPAAPASPK